MKKICILAFTFVLVALTLCACRGRNNNAPTNNTSAPTVDTTPPTTRATQPTTQPTTEQTQPSTMMPTDNNEGSIPGDADTTMDTNPTDDTSVPEGRSRSRRIY